MPPKRASATTGPVRHEKNPSRAPLPIPGREREVRPPDPMDQCGINYIRPRGKEPITWPATTSREPIVFERPYNNMKEYDAGDQVGVKGGDPLDD